jgi:hypothetical protein
MTVQGNQRAKVAALRRPPVRQATTVRAPVEQTFDTFVRSIGVWWPRETVSVGQQRVRDIVLEPEVGGRVFEVWDDDSTVDWGVVTAWDPPARFVMSWRNTPAATEVEFNFSSLGPELSRVEVEHRGWDALTEDQLDEDCAAPGGYRSGAYSRGWALVLERFAAIAYLHDPPIAADRPAVVAQDDARDAPTGDGLATPVTEAGTGGAG